MTEPPETSPAVPTGLHDYVHRRLCGRENLVPELFRTVARPLVRRGAPCGTRFELCGLRDVRLTAVWDASHNVLYFFDARGERFCREPFVPAADDDDLRAAA
ncbi:MAG: hypothetical protein AAF532_14155 [Planctomycetota bacterium]